MNKGHVAWIIYVALVLSTVVFFTLYYTAPRDLSWISEVENYIKKENWDPNREYSPLMGTAFFLNENGEEQFFDLYSEQEFTTYIDGLMNRFVRLFKGYISEESMDEILAADKVLVLSYRFPTEVNAQNRLEMMRNFDHACFVLEDKLGSGLEGTIIIRERNDFRFSVWEIPKGFLG